MLPCWFSAVGNGCERLVQQPKRYLSLDIIHIKKKKKLTYIYTSFSLMRGSLPNSIFQSIEEEMSG